MKRILSYYSPKLPATLVYMAQQVEYSPNAFLSWICTAPNLASVTRRQSLVFTSRARLLIGAIYIWQALNFILFAYLISTGLYLPSFALLILLPISITLLLSGILYFAWISIEKPRRKKLLEQSSRVFKAHPGTKIAIMGSYGKTSMKELLKSMLASSYDVAYTSGNKNVLVSYVRWAQGLSSKEEILLLEYGEGAPGDIAKFAANTHPGIAVITGVAPNHLDQYKTYSALKKDFASIAEFVPKDKIYINGDDDDLAGVIGGQIYSQTQALGWKIENITADYTGTKFVMKKGKERIKIDSKLLGKHQVGPLGFAAVLACELGVPIESIEKSVKSISAYEHRMQPRLLHGAWVIDDTYNGNLQGIKAGLQLLGDLKAKRKIYITPGLVEQGQETERVHIEIGELIAKANPDKVILMQNSVTHLIKQGLEKGGFTNELEIKTDPLLFYSNLEHFIREGDLVMMQNDWTDNYR